MGKNEIKAMVQAEMDEFVSMKVDFVMKLVLHNRKVLRGFLSSLLGLSPQDITDIQFRNTVIDRKYEEGKEGIMDVRVTIMKSKILNIELQIAPFEYWRERTLFYLGSQYVDQGKRGSKYNEFHPCMHISILGFDMFPDQQKYYSRIRLMDMENHEIYTDKLTVHVIELNKLKFVPEEKRDSLFYWCALFNASSKEEYNMLADMNEYMKEAVEVTRQISNDPALREEYLSRRIAMMDAEQLKYDEMKRKREEEERQRDIRESGQKLKEGQQRLEEGQQRLEEGQQRLEEGQQRLKEEEWRIKEEEQRIKEEEQRIKEEEQRIKEEEQRIKEEEQRIKEEEQRIKEEEQRIKEEEQRIKEGERELYLHMREARQRERDTAAKLLEKGMALEFVCEVTGLALEELKKINPKDNS